jgi:hypothetical protein
MAPGTASAERDLAVVIVNYNTREHLLACLSSLASGGLDGLTAAVYVVDNASTDHSAESVRRSFPAVHVVSSAENIGYAAANNIALRLAGFAGRLPAAGQDRSLASGTAAALFRHALLLNPDTVVPPGALAKLVAFLDAEPGLGAVGPKLVLPDGSLDLACRRSFPTPSVSIARFLGLSRLFPGSPRFGRYNLTHLDPDKPADVDSVVGACMMVRGNAVRQAGLLDESFWMYGEDLDWSLRLHAAGWRVGYRPSVVIHHEKRAASRKNPRAAFEFQRAMWIFYRKHYLGRTPRPLHWLIVLGLAVRGGRPLVREMLASARTGHAVPGT